jgi:hypothetical protein
MEKWMRCLVLVAFRNTNKILPVFGIDFGAWVSPIVGIILGIIFWISGDIVSSVLSIATGIFIYVFIFLIQLCIAPIKIKNETGVRKFIDVDSNQPCVKIESLPLEGQSPIKISVKNISRYRIKDFIVSIKKIRSVSHPSLKINLPFNKDLAWGDSFAPRGKRDLFSKKDSKRDDFLIVLLSIFPSQNNRNFVIPTQGKSKRMKIKQGEYIFTIELSGFYWWTGFREEKDIWINLIDGKYGCKVLRARKIKTL